jgi:hypothetical protein
VECYESWQVLLIVLFAAIGAPFPVLIWWWQTRLNRKHQVQSVNGWRGARGRGRGGVAGVGGCSWVYNMCLCRHSCGLMRASVVARANMMLCRANMMLCRAISFYFLVSLGNMVLSPSIANQTQHELLCPAELAVLHVLQVHSVCVCVCVRGEGSMLSVHPQKRSENRICAQNQT